MQTALSIAAAALLVMGCTRIPAPSDAAVCSCEGRDCGDDGCGGTCGTCSDGAECVAGACVGCVPSCTGRDCGDDGCGGLCGTCSVGSICRSGQCECTPYCGDRECGPDGCAGACGICGSGEICSASGACECADPIMCYRDADGDGFAGDLVEACAACPTGYAPLGPEELTDCLDDPTNADSADVHPDASPSETPYCDGTGAECAAGTAPSSYDWNCDGTVTLWWGAYVPPTGLCGCTSHGYVGGGFIDDPVPDCGELGTWRNCCLGPEPLVQQCR